jgi:hypothetical protein
MMMATTKTTVFDDDQFASPFFFAILHMAINYKAKATDR